MCKKRFNKTVMALLFLVPNAPSCVIFPSVEGGRMGQVAGLRIATEGAVIYQILGWHGGGTFRTLSVFSIPVTIQWLLWVRVRVAVLVHSSSPGVTTCHYGCMTSYGHNSCVHSYLDLVSRQLSFLNTLLRNACRRHLCIKVYLCL